MSRVKQLIQIVYDEGMTVAGEQVVVPVLELPCAFLQCIVPCRLPFRFKKLVALQSINDQYLVESISMARTFKISMLHTEVKLWQV
jgi:hypothetical protein